MNSFCSHGQDLTGTWKGYIAGGQILLVLTGADDTLVGYTYDRMTGGGHCKANFKGTYKAARKQLKGEGQGFIENTGDHILCAYKLTYRSDGGTDYLEGEISPRPKDKKNAIWYSGGIWLRRIGKTVDTTAYMAAWWKDRQAKAGQEASSQ